MSSADEGPIRFRIAPPPENLPYVIALFVGIVIIAVYMSGENFFTIKNSSQEDLQILLDSYDQAFFIWVLDIVLLAVCSIIAYLLVMSAPSPRRFWRLFFALAGLSLFSLIPMLIGSYYINSPHLANPKKILNFTS